MADEVKQYNTANNIDEVKTDKKEDEKKKLNIAKMLKKMDNPKEHYTKEEMDELEDFAKKYKEFISKAKDRNKKYEKANERKRRTNQMCEFGGEIEKAYKELYDKYYWTEKNKPEIEKLLKMIIEYYKKVKAETEKENQPKKKENPQPSQTATTAQPAQPQAKTAP